MVESKVNERGLDKKVWEYTRVWKIYGEGKSIGLCRNLKSDWKHIKWKVKSMKEV